MTHRQELLQAFAEFDRQEAKRKQGNIKCYGPVPKHGNNFAYIGGIDDLRAAIDAQITRERLAPVEPRAELCRQERTNLPWIVAGLSWSIVGLLLLVAWWRT